MKAAGPIMHLFAELMILLCFLLSAAHAIGRHGREGAGFFGALLLLGLARENFVVLRDLLYGFAPLRMMLGRAPLIAAIIWGFSIYAALLWAESVSADGGALLGRRAAPSPSPARPLPSVAMSFGLVGLFMIALACFYEPFLKRIEMARWQAGTQAILDVPLMALIGYPTMAWTFLALWLAVRTWVRARALRVIALVGLIPPLAIAHAAALQELKDALHW